MSPSLEIPFNGLKLENDISTKSASTIIPAIGLSLNDGMIEEMIRCAQNGKSIELSLGGNPNLIYGNKSHTLSVYEDPFTYELYQTNSPSDNDAKSNSRMSSAMRKPQSLHELMFAKKRLVTPDRAQVLKTVNLKTGKVTAVTPAQAGGDAALANLRDSIASEKARKENNTTKLIKDGLPVPGQRRTGATKVTNKSKFLSQNAKSMPTSPALSGVGSPSLGPTSVPLSQKQAEAAKSSRKPIVHLLALEPMSEKALHDKITGAKEDFHQALSKVADLNNSTNKWELSKNYYKELDVFSYEYETEQDRQRVIDNAVKIFDKMRLGTSEPQWDKLLPKSERGTGKCLSKLQAQIAQGPVAKPKTNGSASKKDSSRNSPAVDEDEEDIFGDKNSTKPKGETMARSTPQPPATKSKKPSEKDAQAKRLFSKNPPKAAAPKPKAAKPAKKEIEKVKANAKPLSSQFVSESDDDEAESKKEPVSKPVKKPSNKRLREEEVDSSDSSMPLSKKSKTVSNNNHRISDASQSSRPSSNSTSSSANSFKGKGNSPQKSSPLASSPPTNASEFDNSSAGDRSSSSASPTHHNITSNPNGRSPIHKRHQKSSSVTSSSSSGTRYLKPGVLSLANKYKTFYPKYEALHRELAALGGARDEGKEKDLLDMHERLSILKQQILEGIVEE